MNGEPLIVHTDDEKEHEFISQRLEIVNFEVLAQLLSEVALGKSMHAAEILSGRAQYSATQLRKMAVESALKLFDMQANGDPYHRDGWMLQVISWVASQTSYKGALQQSPHMRHAHKGLDGICIVLSESKDDVAYCVVSEDKATTKARQVFREDIIPELKSFQDGTETSLLTESITSLLSNVDIEGKDEIIESILWEQGLRYRLTLTTTTDSHEKNEGRASLFKEFKSVIEGKNERRTVVTLHNKEIRQWFSTLALRCQALITQRMLDNV